MQTVIEALIERIDLALVENNGVMLSEAWAELYELDKAEAMHVAMIMKPLAKAAR